MMAAATSRVFDGSVVEDAKVVVQCATGFTFGVLFGAWTALHGIGSLTIATHQHTSELQPLTHSISALHQSKPQIHLSRVSSHTAPKDQDPILHSADDDQEAGNPFQPWQNIGLKVLSVAAFGMLAATAILSLLRRTSLLLDRTETIALATVTSQPVPGNDNKEVDPLAARQETKDEAQHRRRAESKEVEERVISICSLPELQEQLRANTDPKHLFVIEVMDFYECSTGLLEEAEIQWKQTEAEIMAPCNQFKHTFQRTARRCPDVTFLQVMRDETPEVALLLERLEVKVFPSLLFIKENRVVWRHEGCSGVDDDFDDGMQWFGDTSTDGSHPSELVPDLRNLAELETFRKPSNSNDLLRVVLVLTGTSNSCIRLYPVLPAVAKHMKGKATFARMSTDKRDALDALRLLNVQYVPLMVIYDAKTGEELARHVVSSRGDLIGLFLQSLEKMEKEMEGTAPGIVLPLE